MGNKSIIQIVLVVISVVIIVTYIKPTFAEIKLIQEQTDEYVGAYDNVASFNAELQSLLRDMDAISVSERRALDRYLPSDIDVVSVMRDIQTIAEKNNMVLMSLSSAIPAEDTVNTVQVVRVQGDVPQPPLPLEIQQFDFTVAGSYEDFKTLLQDFEKSAYPLEVAEINFSSRPDNDAALFEYEFNFVLETYSLISESE